MTNPNFEYYKVFYYVGKHQNLTTAAHLLSTSQPSVSRSIKNLEYDLSCRLFVRSKKGVTFTPEGALLYNHIASACESIFEGEKALSRALHLESGTVAIGTTEIAIHCYLLEKLASFHKAHPKVTLTIINRSAPVLIDEIKSGAIDIAVLTTPIKDEKNLAITEVKRFRDVLVAGPAFSHLGNRILTIEELPTYPLITLSKETATYRFYSSLYASHEMAWKADIELATADLLIPFIKQNLGIGFVPQIMASPALASGEIRALTLSIDIPEREICIVQDKRHPLSAASRQLIHSLASGDPSQERT
ncbi:LysR family transcriptional regulator [Sediminispirochaeta bajacaliforniensis]|uniref:LysR family transcriptional regulator n=1 Tax=Sediminispirochaeta bajacaliforniensis TaxID=148 RepID=UPI00036DEC9A|nr:LysR family transcriptional regulator [Sediminispirochaeta bajacaliforniensis]